MNTQIPNINTNHKKLGCFSSCFNNCQEKIDDFCFDEKSRTIRTIKQINETQSSSTTSKLESTSLTERIAVYNQNQTKSNIKKSTK